MSSPQEEYIEKRPSSGIEGGCVVAIEIDFKVNTNYTVSLELMTALLR